uniref:Uncharacterized protein n=1 Tax=Rhizophora mucronata TaxID=61149 RepID=A0A2P2PIJ2_RHIMU
MLRMPCTQTAARTPNENKVKPIFTIKKQLHQLCRLPLHIQH